MENTLFLGDFPIETSIHRGFSIAMYDYRRVQAAFTGETADDASVLCCDRGLRSCSFEHQAGFGLCTRCSSM